MSESMVRTEEEFKKLEAEIKRLKREWSDATRISAETKIQRNELAKLTRKICMFAVHAIPEQVKIEWQEFQRINRWM